MVVGLAAALAVVFFTPSAYGHHSDEERITDRTAYSLGQEIFRIGIWKFEVGILDDLDVGTLTLPWIIKMANLHLKYEFEINEQWSIAPRIGFLSLDMQTIDPESPEAVFAIVPLELVGSFRVGDFTISLEAIYTYVGLSGSYESDALEGAAAVTNLQITNSIEWRVSRVTALLLHSRYLLFQDASASTSAQIQADEYTTIEIHGAIESDVVDVGNAFSIVPSVHFSWETFNLRLGVGWGNWSLPGINFVLPMTMPIPEIDFFWQW